MSEITNSSANLEIELRIMSYNIKNDYDRQGNNTWASRRDLVAGLIRFHRVDLVGMQEVLHHQLLDLEERLPGYGWIGAGREDGQQEGEYVCIFYLKKRMQPLEHGHFWLSPTPEQPGALGWDAVCPRMVTWCRFRDMYTGSVFVHLNTHFDHVGTEAVKQSARLIKERIASMAPDGAALLTGDFNVASDSEAYRILCSQVEGGALLSDAAITADYHHFGPTFTFQDFDAGGVAARLFPAYFASGSGTGLEYESAIDFIFTTSKVEVRHFGVIADHHQGKLPSDHFPVIADLLMHP